MADLEGVTTERETQSARLFAVRDALLAQAGVSDVVVSADGPTWMDVRGTYLRAPFEYRVSGEDERAAARAIYSHIKREWDNGELIPTPEQTDG